MPRADVNGIVLEYETLGVAGGPAVVVTVGLGAQLVQCTDEFCRPFVERGYFVVRYDNRDSGLSSAVPGRPYGLPDMADDLIGLLDALHLDGAHLVGASMGGMIAQEAALRAPHRVRSLCSAIATTGDPAVGRSTAAAQEVLAEPVPRERAAAVEHSVRVWRTVGSPRFAGEEDHVRALARAAYDRAFRPEGRKRQLRALHSATDRTAGLRGLRVPTLVVHGDADPVIDISGGYATAAAVPDATWLEIAGMGHDLPRAVWPEITAAILRNAERTPG